MCVLKVYIIYYFLFAVQNPELEARLDRIKMDLERKEYNKLVMNVAVSEKAYRIHCGSMGCLNEKLFFRIMKYLKY